MDARGAIDLREAGSPYEGDLDPYKMYVRDLPRRREVLRKYAIGYDRKGKLIPAIGGGLDFYVAEPVGPFPTAAGAAFNTFTTKKDVSPAPIPVILGGKLRRGTGIYMRAQGEYSTTGNVTFTPGFWFGTRALAITGDIALGSITGASGAAAAWPWWMEWDGMCTEVGAAGTLLGQGQFQYGSSLTAFNAETPIPVTQALRTVSGFDTTIERAVGVSWTWGTSAGGNQVIVNRLRVMIWN